MTEGPNKGRSWKFQYLWNTASNYGKVVIRMATGLILFRMLFSNLDSESFGMWALLWSVFGYGILLDFGLGFACQKVVAEKQVTKDIDGINSMLATVFWAFCGLATIIVASSFILRPWALNALGVDRENIAEMSQAYTIFFIGMAIIFPTGIFTEVLRGMQRFDWVNGAMVIANLINFGALWYALETGLNLSTLMTISLATTLLPNLISAALAFLHLKGLSLNPKYFSWSGIKPQIGFSIAAYLITCSNMITGKSDQMVVGFIIGVSGVALYQSGYKIAEMFSLFVIQIQEALSPLAASLNALEDKSAFLDVYFRAQRLTLVISVSLCALCFAYVDSLILVLTGMEYVPDEARYIGLALLLTILSSQITNSVSKRMLMMSGYEKPLLAISISDACLNIVISILLAYHFGIVGVALGSLIPTVLVGWFWVMPLTLSALKTSPQNWFRKACLPEFPWLAAGVGILASWLYIYPGVASDSPLELIKMSLIPGLVFITIIGVRLKQILL